MRLPGAEVPPGRRRPRRRSRRPRAGHAEPPRPRTVLRPPVSPDTAFFWAGTAAGELRIQRCGECGALRHPPGPMCPRVRRGPAAGYQVAAGTGKVYSYVVHHHPPVPGKHAAGRRRAGRAAPRASGWSASCSGSSPDQVRIGMPVRVDFVPVDAGLVLPAWREDPR